MIVNDDADLASRATHNPMTKMNWEGVGIEPDVKIPPADALDAALELTRTKLDGASVVH